MNHIQASGIASCISLLLIWGKPIYSESKTFMLADSASSDRQARSLVIGASEEMNSYEGKGRSNILVTKGGSVSFMNLRDSATASVKGGEISHLFLYDTSSLKLFDSGKQNNSAGKSSDIGFIHLHDSATALIEGEEVAHINLYNTSDLSVSGSSVISHLTLHDTSSLSVSGSQKIDHLTLEEETHGEIFDARVGSLTLRDRSVVHVRSLDIQGDLFSAPGVEVSGGAIVLGSNTALNIYGREINFADGKLSGTWVDGTHFEFWLIRRIKDNWFWSLWRAGDDELTYEIPKSMPNQVIFHQISE